MLHFWSRAGSARPCATDHRATSQNPKSLWGSSQWLSSPGSSGLQLAEPCREEQAGDAPRKVLEWPLGFSLGFSLSAAFPMTGRDAVPLYNMGGPKPAKTLGTN